MKYHIMKKSIMAFTLVLVIFALAACGGSSDDDTYNSDWIGTINASQGIQVKSAESGEVFKTYSEQSEIDQFMDSLAVDKWEPVTEDTSDLQKEYSVIFYKLNSSGSEGSDDENANQSVVARLTTYKDSSIITMESLGLSFTMKVPDSAVEAISSVQP